MVQFDLSLVIEREQAALRRAAPFLVRHRAEFLQQLETRESVLRTRFEAIDVMTYRPTFDVAASRARTFLEDLPMVTPQGGAG